MTDFGALPPEINSARMYGGPGPGPMLAAASAWDAIATGLATFAAAYSEETTTLHGQSWFGPASTAMAAAAAPYLGWASTTSAQAEETAVAARAAASAFETAFAATVHPAAVAANRVQLAVLVATNFFGQNTAAIAATEAAYAEMWAQDAAAMYGYAGASALAADVDPFAQPPQTTSAIAQLLQGNAVAQAADSAAENSQATLSAVPAQLQSLASGGAAKASAADALAPLAPILSVVADFNTLTGPLNIVYQLPFTTFAGGNFVNAVAQSEIQGTDLPVIAEERAAGAAATARLVVPGGGDPVLAGVGRAAPIGGLSAPPNWTSAVPTAAPAVEPTTAIKPASRVLPPWAAHPPATTSGAMPPVGITDGSGRRGGNAVFRMRDRRYRMPRPVIGG